MCVYERVRLSSPSLSMRAVAGRLLAPAATLILAVAMAGLGTVSAWANDSAPAAEAPPPPAPVETPVAPALVADDSPPGRPSIESEDPETAVPPGSLPSTRPIGSSDGSGPSDVSIAGVSSGQADGVVVPAPPQSERIYDPVGESVRQGPDPTDVTPVG